MRFVGGEGALRQVWVLGEFEILGGAAKLHPGTKIFQSRKLRVVLVAS